MPKSKSTTKKRNSSKKKEKIKEPLLNSKVPRNDSSPTKTNLPPQIRKSNREHMPSTKDKRLIHIQLETEATIEVEEEPTQEEASVLEEEEIAAEEAEVVTEVDREDSAAVETAVGE